MVGDKGMMLVGQQGDTGSRHPAGMVRSRSEGPLRGLSYPLLLTVPPSPCPPGTGSLIMDLNETDANIHLYLAGGYRTIACRLDRALSRCPSFQPGGDVALVRTTNATPTPLYKVQLRGEEILDAIQGLTRTQDTLSLRDESGWQFSPTPDVQDDTVARFGAGRFRTTFHSIRSLLQS